MASTNQDSPQGVAPTGQDAAVLGDVLLLTPDVQSILPGLDNLLRPAGYRVRACATIDQARALIERIDPIVGLLHLSRGERFAVGPLEALLEAKPMLRLIALVEPSHDVCAHLAPLIRRELIYDYHTLPLDLDRLLHALGHINGLVAVERGAGTGAEARAAQTTKMVGASTALAGVAEAIRKVARSQAPVLIHGESGTGKELVARAIHDGSSRSSGPFVAVNCAALPPSLIGSELFGHEKGAFTGALMRRIGRIETAGGGTLFLDEIGDLPLEFQGHFLRFLQERTIDRIGGTTPIEVDARVLAATHVDLAKAQTEGRFREDLFYRLNVLMIELPPLRERGGDVELLAKHYLDRFSRELGRPLLGFRENALQAIRAHPWPGNVRELISSIQRAAVMAEGKWVSATDLGLDHKQAQATISRSTLHEARAELEKRLIREALDASGQTVQAAARRLGVSRMTFYRMLERYGLSTEKSAEGPVVPASPDEGADDD